MKTKIILEFGCNHQGDLNIAVDMINQASLLGVYGVKFQKRDIESMPEELKQKPRDPDTSFGKNYYEHRKALEFSSEQLFDLKEYAENKGIVFSCSAFDLESAYKIAELDCKHIKLPSQLYSDKRLQKQLAIMKETFGLHISVSTGMHNYEEVVNNEWLNIADVIYHCISIYPCELKEMNLSFIAALNHMAHDNAYKVGYSSHDTGGLGIKHAVIAGADYIERHFTLDKKMKGSDHSTVSSDYGEMQRIIEDIKMAEEILGNKRECNEGERATRKIYRGF